MNTYIQMAIELRKELHLIAEASMEERNTKEKLVAFTSQAAELEMHDEGSWFYVKWNAGSDKTTICFRGDFDAVKCADGICRHVCGHDGHAAILAAFSRWVADTKPDINIICLFQPGEETGEGAKICCHLFDQEQVDHIYGFHNIPGHKSGQLLLRYGTFACASTGLAIKMSGNPAHAAYPEAGNNPAMAMAQLMTAIDQYVKEAHRGMMLATVIGIDLGSTSYGVSASEGTLRLTVRAEYYDEFEALLTFIRSKVQRLQEHYGVNISMQEIEKFPATENSEAEVKLLHQKALMNGWNCDVLQDPFRWSEDFGWYLQRVPGTFFGIGAGEEHPQLHTAEYEFNDAIIENVLQVYAGICEQKYHLERVEKMG